MTWLIRLWRWLFGGRAKQAEPSPSFVISFDEEGLNYRLLCSSFTHSGTRKDWEDEHPSQRRGPYQPTCHFARVIGPSSHVRLFYLIFGDVCKPRDMRVEAEGCYPCVLRGVVLTSISMSVAAGDLTIMEDVHAVCHNIYDELPTEVG